MTAQFDALWAQALPAFAQRRTWERGHTLALSAVACLGRHTISGLLTCSGQQARDWTGAYRLFSQERLDLGQLWAPVRRTLYELLPAGPFYAALDDTLVGKRGRKVPGARFRRDPQGPRFRANLIWAQRFLQVTALLPQGSGAGGARAIPLDLQHCPGPRPGREQESARLTTMARDRLTALRGSLDAEGARQRPLVVAVDGGYTNRTVLRALPERTILIGRIRKDAKLYAPPALATGRGRPAKYGPALPTPEQLRQDDRIPWQTVEAHAAGRRHNFQVKVVEAVRWRGAGERDLKLVIIRPLGYRPTKRSRVCYREPAYLVGTDPHLPLAQLLQAFVWRWEVEVTFREEKTILGLGEAQVRNQHAVSQAPAFIAAVYAYLHLAAALAGAAIPSLPRPKWQHPQPTARVTTGCLVSTLRAELWGKALGVHLSDFATPLLLTANPPIIQNSALSAVLYSQK